jgi:hypothetical protein
MKNREDEEEEEEEEEDLVSANEESEFDEEWEPPGKKFKTPQGTMYVNLISPHFLTHSPDLLG